MNKKVVVRVVVDPDEYWGSDDIKVSIGKEQYDLNCASLTNGFSCCGIDEIDELAHAFSANKRRLGKLLNDAQVMYLTLKGTLRMHKEDEGRNLAFYIATMPTSRDYIDASRALDKLGLMQTKARKNPNTRNDIKLYVIDPITFMKKHLPK
jgi:hypothetical protein